MMSEISRGTGNGLYMQFCDSSHDVTRMQQEEKQQHQKV